MNNLSLNKAFELCADHLADLPECWKKWKTLSEYRNQWSFIEDSQIRNGISEQEMALDYLWSLYEWLQPGLTLEIAHKLIFAQGLAAIYEAILIDLWKKEILGNKLGLFLISKFEKESFSSLVKNSNKAELITDEWFEYLDDLRKVRNLIHIPKNKRIEILESKIFKKTPGDLKSDLDNFRKFIKDKYKEEDIPF